MTTVLIVPGLGGSGPEHWQSRWENIDARCVRVQQRDWNAPVCSAWITSLEQAVRDAAGEVVLVAHSLGVVLVAHWARSGSVHKVKGALLVAPPDVARDFEERLRAGGLGYGDLKKALFERYWDCFANARQRRAELAADPAHVNGILADGARRARLVADTVLKRARLACGLE